jgi:hypothetical protein
MSAPKGLGSGLKRFFFLWDFPRASWPYDIMVILILAFIFLTPRDFFRDQPRPRNIVQVTAEHGTSGFWLEADLLESVGESERAAAAQRLIRSQAGARGRNVISVEPIYDDEHDLRGYRVYTRP